MKTASNYCHPPGAGNAVVLDGTKATTVPQASLSANAPSAAAASQRFGSMTVAQYFASTPSTVADSQLKGNQIYINPGMIFGNPGDVTLNSAYALHEVIHNVTGLTDSEMQALLPTLTVQFDSANITKKLILDCF
jgi:hypothetical protein